MTMKGPGGTPAAYTTKAQAKPAAEAKTLRQRGQFIGLSGSSMASPWPTSCFSIDCALSEGIVPITDVGSGAPCPFAVFVLSMVQSMHFNNNA